MNKYIFAGALVLAFAFGGVALAANPLAKMTLFAEPLKLNSSIYKATDPANGATCYVMYFGESGAALDCVK